MPNKKYTIKQAIDAVSDAYRKASNSHWGTVYDVVNAGLYVAAPFTGGATLPAAMLMTGIQGAGSVADMASKGITANNVIDTASMIPGFGLAEKGVKAVAKPIMRSVGKTTKLIKNATKYAPTVENNIVKGIQLGKTHPTLWQLTKEDSKYIPYGTLVYGEDLLNHGLNIGQVANDLKDSKFVESYRQGGTVEQVETGKSGIYIKPENRGKFTALKKRTGKSASWFKEHGTPAQKKMAVFALNARKWNKGKKKK